jgi:hypothetical protein
MPWNQSDAIRTTDGEANPIQFGERTDQRYHPLWVIFFAENQAISGNKSRVVV